MSFRIQFCQSTASESGSETTADDSGSSSGRAARRRPRAAACGSGISLILLHLLATFCFVFSFWKIQNYLWEALWNFAKLYKRELFEKNRKISWTILDQYILVHRRACARSAPGPLRSAIEFAGNLRKLTRPNWGIIPNIITLEKTKISVKR